MTSAARPCRDCGAEVVFLITGNRLHPDGTMTPRRTPFELRPVPTATCRVLAVAFDRRRRVLVDVQDVARPPTECYPVHRCPQALERMTLERMDTARPDLDATILGEAMARPRADSRAKTPRQESA